MNSKPVDLVLRLRELVGLPSAEAVEVSCTYWDGKTQRYGVEKNDSEGSVLLEAAAFSTTLSESILSETILSFAINVPPKVWLPLSSIAVRTALQQLAKYTFPKIRMHLQQTVKAACYAYLVISAVGFTARRICPVHLTGRVCYCVIFGSIFFCRN